MSVRKVERIVEGNVSYDGAGVKLVRVLGLDTIKDFDPFLMLDFFDSRNPADYINGFPWHPHRGIETVTYLIDGEIEHGDSLKNKGVIGKGCCQWMTAGSGIIHQEMPKPAEQLLGIQLWINLPKKHKMAMPAYRDIQETMIPKTSEDNARIAVIAGEYKEHKGVLEGDYVKTQYLDVEIKPSSEWEIDTKKENTVFVMLVRGSASFDGSKEIKAPAAVLFSKGSKLMVKSGSGGARFVLLSAKPLKEPVAWAGPIVMNTEEELRQTFEELDRGTFIKENHPKNGI